MKNPAVVDTHSQPLVSIDVVPIRYNREGRALEIALGERLYEPYAGVPALPGVLLLQAESVTHAAYRALSTKIGMLGEHSGVLRQIGAFDGTNRDPRGATISIALAAVGGTKASRATWVSVDEVDALPFDHEVIIEGAVARIGEMWWRDDDVTQYLLGEKFTTADVLALSDLLDSYPADPANIRRWLTTNSKVVQQPGFATPTGRGRPSAVWGWA